MGENHASTVDPILKLFFFTPPRWGEQISLDGVWQTNYLIIDVQKRQCSDSETFPKKALTHHRWEKIMPAQ